MTHELQERYSALVLAKIRKELVLKDGVVFNTDYEGSPAAGAVKIPVRDKEVAVSDYDKANGITAGTGGTSYETMVINKDKAVNEIIDNYDAAAVPDNLVAERLDSAGYALAKQMDLGRFRRHTVSFQSFRRDSNQMEYVPILPDQRAVGFDLFVFVAHNDSSVIIFQALSQLVD